MYKIGEFYKIEFHSQKSVNIHEGGNPPNLNDRKSSSPVIFYTGKVVDEDAHAINILSIYNEDLILRKCDIRQALVVLNYGSSNK